MTCDLQIALNLEFYLLSNHTSSSNIHSLESFFSVHSRILILSYTSNINFFHNGSCRRINYNNPSVSRSCRFHQIRQVPSPLYFTYSRFSLRPNILTQLSHISYVHHLVVYRRHLSDLEPLRGSSIELLPGPNLTYCAEHDCRFSNGATDINRPLVPGNSRF